VCGGQGEGGGPGGHGSGRWHGRLLWQSGCMWPSRAKVSPQPVKVIFTIGGSTASVGGSASSSARTHRGALARVCACQPAVGQLLQEGGRLKGQLRRGAQIREQAHHDLVGGKHARHHLWARRQAGRRRWGAAAAAEAAGVSGSSMRQRRGVCTSAGWWNAGTGVR
jgi:hypothetical protein